MNFKDSNLCWEKPKRKLRAKRRDEVVSGHWGMTMSHSFNSLICLLEAFAFCCLYSNKRKRFPLYHCEKSVTCVPLFIYLFIYYSFIVRKKRFPSEYTLCRSLLFGYASLLFLQYKK